MTALYFGWPAYRNRHFVISGGGGGHSPHYIHPWWLCVGPLLCSSGAACLQTLKRPMPD